MDGLTKSAFYELVALAESSSEHVLGNNPFLFPKK